MNTLKAAEFLDSAFLEKREVDRLTLSAPLSIPEAYQIQDLVVERRLARGEKIIGYKMGLTSKAKMKQMGVDSPIYGVLTSGMALSSGASFRVSSSIHAKIEPEIAFILGKDLRGKVTRGQALDACEAVCAAMEIIDSRYRNFQFELPDVIADNCSGHAFVLGETRRKPSELDIANLGMLLEVNGVGSQFGSSSAIYGDPVDSLLELCKMLDARGRSLPAGSIVLAGAATAAIPMGPDEEIRTSVQDLGSVAIRSAH